MLAGYGGYQYHGDAGIQACGATHCAHTDCAAHLAKTNLIIHDVYIYIYKNKQKVM